MRYLLICTCFILLSHRVVYSQSSNFTIGFYNCENLYDTINNLEVNDEEFLPNSTNQWTSARFYTKLNHTAQVIASMNEQKGPDLLGLCEIENRGVLENLVKDPLIVAKNYQIIHHDSPDLRGIDVALLYNPKTLNVKSNKTYPIHFPNDPTTKTRDILVVNASTTDLASIFIIVAHFPSRRGGTEESEPKRLFVAQRIRSICDSLTQKDSTIRLVIMGDFNDEPINKSIGTVLLNPETPGHHVALYNPFITLKQAGQGTIFYKNEWSLFDQIILSYNLVNKVKASHYLPNSATINKPDFVLEQTGKFKGAPFRTYVGPKYMGGYSDHMSVYLVLTH